ncbi:hypothetical protein IEQ34_000206 [Dendrobium chrysotoxum]|uniref:Uncharacterized protein n=1 Tax=Dendrobium chrysotoxum TaxID=161865 RepID=A0AAV7HS88_DENCH|nr:hypothetical protein IEQ34_000206 [Dendrobium chrysotoxum]
MTDRGKEPATEEGRNLESLWANQDNVNRRIDELAADIHQLGVEMRREFNLLRAGHPQPRRYREELPAVRPIHRRGIAADRFGAELLSFGPIGLPV